MAEELAPAHSRVKPAWVQQLHDFAVKFIKPSSQAGSPADASGKNIAGSPADLFANKSFPFAIDIPTSFIDMQEMSIPNVWPTMGDVNAMKAHYYPHAGLPDGDSLHPTFPPRGVSLMVITPNNPPRGERGEFKRVNLDTIYLAWLSAFKDVMDSNTTQKRAWVTASKYFHATVSLAATEKDKLKMAYQFQEDIEIGAERLGHSPLTKAREYVSIQETLGGVSASDVSESLVGVKFANKASEVTPQGARMHLRVLRRFSLAVADEVNPAYEKSGLYYLEKCQEIWGRRTPQTALNENIRHLDAFQAGALDLSDLQIACETHFHILLRGNNVNIKEKSIAPYVRACILYTKVGRRGV